MQIQFDEWIDRSNTNCAKYDEMNWKSGKDLLHCAVADMDFRSPKPVIEAMRKVVEHGVFGYTVLPRQYSELVAEWMNRRYSADVNPEWVLFSPRINMAMNMIVETFTKKGDEIIVFTPVYPAFTNAVCKYDRVLKSSPLVLEKGVWQIDFDNLSTLVSDRTKMMFFCNPHNPTGRVWSTEELKKIGEFCLRHNLLLVSDDIHADFVRDGNQYKPVWKACNEVQNQTIILNSISKTINVPGIILSNIIVPNDKIRTCVKETIDRWGLHNPNIFAASILEAAYRECDDWIEDVNSYITENIRTVVSYVANNLPGLEAYCPEGTYMMWIDYRKLHLTEKEMEQCFLQRGKLAVYWGSHFGEQWDGFFRINVATTKECVGEIIDRIRESAIGKLRG